MAMAEKATIGIWKKTNIFFSQVRTEMAKVSWPSQEDCKNYAIVVIVATAIVGVMMALWDFALAKALAALLQVGVSG